ncbi:Peptidase inhibitor 15-A [Characodon lateralis]|uniref:Peptidase inhibitor 15-A n=2 Tax=Goodeidae TaxID=28758 RepID=A0ABU7DDR9_9TELE|nr:Peptidase inhibitor 15-A [Characodon lateralis]
MESKGEWLGWVSSKQTLGTRKLTTKAQDSDIKGTRSSFCQERQGGRPLKGGEHRGRLGTIYYSSSAPLGVTGFTGKTRSSHLRQGENIIWGLGETAHEGHVGARACLYLSLSFRSNTGLPTLAQTARRALKDASWNLNISSAVSLKPNMKLQLFAIDLVVMCISWGASALATSPIASTSAPGADINGFGAAHGHGENGTVSKTRRKRYISQNDMIAILDYHNKVRGRVFPPASNMEYMVWDETLAKTAEDWAHACLWEHGPPHLLRFLGQNLSVRTGRYRSILQLVKPWYDEVKDYSFPYPRDCNPRCPLRCYGPMCTHYTQMVWATSNKIGCAVHTCHNMNVWGSVWKRATYLVCNYSPKGNWIGEAPYKVGVPCSACPPSYGGSCSNNMCFPALKTNYLHWFK